MEFKGSLSKLLFLLSMFLLMGHVSSAQTFNSGGLSQNNFSGGLQSPNDTNKAPAFVKDTTSTRDREIKTFRYRDSIQYYKVINYRGDTTLVDTSNTISAYNRINQRRKDDFGYMPFPNAGQGYTPLVFEQKKGLSPYFGHASRDMYYHTEEDMLYYDVRTPFSEVMYYSYVFANSTGQLLDFRFAVNPLSNWNIATGYRGIKTFGSYSYSDSSHGHFFLTSIFYTKDKKYQAKAHVTFQFLSNVENGGLTEQSMTDFLDGNPEFDLRASLNTNLSTDQRTVANRLGGMRVFVDHKYDLFNSSINDPEKFRVSILNEIVYENKSYKYIDPAFSSPVGIPNAGAKKSRDYYDSNMSFTEIVYNELEGNQLVVKRDTIIQRTDSTLYQRLDINAGVGVNIPLVNIYVEGKINYSYDNYSAPYYKSTVDFANSKEFELPYRKTINGSTSALLLHATIKPMKYFGAEVNFKYNFAGLWKDARELQASAYVQLNEQNRLSGSYLNSSYYPQITSSYYVSGFEKFNWENSFERIGYNEIKIDLNSKKIIDAGVSMINIKNYVYYDHNRVPKQAPEGINILSAYIAKDLKIGGFGFDIKAQYQNVTSGSQYLPLPQFLGRLNVYYQWNMFNKALNVMAGVTVNYFTAFDAQQYNPLLSDYNLQNPDNARAIGNFPFTDVFLAFKIRRTRIYLRFENASSLFGNTNYLSSPDMPFMDATLRFGIVWDWFN